MSGERSCQRLERSGILKSAFLSALPPAIRLLRGCGSQRRPLWLRQYYEWLRAAGNPGKVAVVAAMRKLLTAFWSVATHRKPFVPHLPGVPARLGVLTNKA